MRARRLLALALAPLLASCELLEPGASDRVPGRYRLLTYDGRPLPVVLQGQAGGDGVVLVSAEMELRRNFRWVLVQHLDSTAGGVHRPGVLADSGTFRFNTEPGELFVFTADGFPHRARVAGDTVDVFWRNTRHDIFVR